MRILDRGPRIPLVCGDTHVRQEGVPGGERIGIVRNVDAGRPGVDVPNDFAPKRRKGSGSRASNVTWNWLLTSASWQPRRKLQVDPPQSRVSGHVSGLLRRY